MAMGDSKAPAAHSAQHQLHPPLAVMTALSVLVLAAGLAIAWLFGGLSAG
jgi:hypothetical protein